MVLRYTALRLLIFFGCLALLWLLGLRGAYLPWLVVGAAILSMVISAIVLRPMRQQYIEHVGQRLARRSTRTGTDEQVEDAALDGTASEAGTAPDPRAPASPREGDDEEPEEYR